MGYNLEKKGRNVTMMDYLFRGKDKDGKWVYGSLVVAEGKTYIFEDDGWTFVSEISGAIDGVVCPVDSDSVGQYVGLEDANGQKIFEGDIVKWELDGGDVSWYLIGFYEGSFAYRELEYSGNDLCWDAVYDHESRLVNEEVHVVGNIYNLLVDPPKWARINVISPEELTVALENSRKEK